MTCQWYSTWVRRRPLMMLICCWTPRSSTRDGFETTPGISGRSTNSGAATGSSSVETTVTSRA
ncbi:MAG: hypothetical protein R3F20_07545 [Planctomycetota bacterium]